jgi:antitoxin component of MazEF toxin-antitoxin module
VARDVLKVRKVGGTLVVTLTQGVLEEVPLAEGDRVLIEALPPRRILISKEVPDVPSTRRIELELQILEAKRESFESQMAYAVADYNLNGSQGDSEYLDGSLKYLTSERDKIAVAIAEKKLELFELQGA